MEETISEVDNEDNIIGEKPKPYFEDPKHRHRSSHLLIFNRKGEILIQKRSKQKKKYPGLWDWSMSGTVRAGETYEQTLEREMQEELGIIVRYNRLFKYSYADDIDNANKTVYAAEYEGRFELQKEEVDEVRWVSAEELAEWMKQRPQDFCAPFLKGIKIYLRKISKHY